ncbi:S-adenosyl-L-methionine-dependent methyltransferase-like [Lasallia pustulata]|uniref:S-adenosyl-L-methionine-dependent methyltransferase-like n=1 Tax=Lasallia pustulata TaxID=136370 RepID=A0A1W5CW41_9LECA|nr:S-adenosyl-L-methionine-dependent methyltransferase-like [Lasallia pustulata]
MVLSYNEDRPQVRRLPRHIETAPRKFRKGPWIIGGLAVYAFTAYGFYLYSSLSRIDETSQILNVPEDVSDRYNNTAKEFDDQVNLTEQIMGIGLLRKSLTKRASGDVLEVSVGTGRNMKYYNFKKCKSITMVDQSEEMIEIAKQKFKDLHSRYRTYTFLTQSALDHITCPTSGGFDTIVQTMGLCSTPHPSELLTHLGVLANPSHGQILLLEHGRSYYDWLNRLLDKTAPAHADRHGCWWNRDIGKIVEESGLEVVKIKRYHLGTTWWVELKPKKRVEK